MLIFRDAALVKNYNKLKSDHKGIQMPLWSR